MFYLLASHDFLRQDFEKRHSISVVPLKHLANDGQQIPHAFRLAASQRAQQAAPLRRRRRCRRAQVVDIATKPIDQLIMLFEATSRRTKQIPENRRRWHAKFDEDFPDVFVQRVLVEAPRRLLARRRSGGWIRSAAYLSHKSESVRTSATLSTLCQKSLLC